MIIYCTRVGVSFHGHAMDVAYFQMDVNQESRVVQSVRESGDGDVSNAITTSVIYVLKSHFLSPRLQVFKYIYCSQLFLELHKHSLFVSPKLGWICQGTELFLKGCESGITDKKESLFHRHWRCEKCDFDLCDICVEKVPTPTKNHGKLISICWINISIIL